MTDRDRTISPPRQSPRQPITPTHDRGRDGPRFHAEDPARIHPRDRGFHGLFRPPAGDRRLYQRSLILTHRDGFPRLSARSAWRGDVGHRKPCAPSQSHGPSESLGKPPFRSRGRTGSGRIGGGVGKPRRCPASPAASLLPAQWPGGSPARSLWVIINAPWY